MRRRSVLTALSVLQVSRLTTPGGGFDSRLSFGEFCRSVGESEARREFNVAVAELARSRKLVRAVRGAPLQRRVWQSTAHHRDR